MPGLEKVAPESTYPLLAPTVADRAELLGGGRFTPELLTVQERSLCVERAITGLYRWYTSRSQQTRNWNADSSFAWKDVRRDHGDPLHVVIEGFYAVEQYVPDYVTALLKVIRQSYGRSQMHLRWGAEEEKHADVWRNAVLSMGRRSVSWMEDYTGQLRGREFQLPWDDALHMLFYAVFQERATQVNYLNLSLAVSSRSNSPVYSNDDDPVLEEVARTIAIDEAAHYHFFLEAARVFLYYFPLEATVALVDVMRHFTMPARDLIPDYDHFANVLHSTGIFTQRIHYRDVIAVALEQLGVRARQALEDGIRRSREIPGPDGAMRVSAIFDAIDHDHVAQAVERVFGVIDDYAKYASVEHTIPPGFRVARARIDA